VVFLPFKFHVSRRTQSADGSNLNLTVNANLGHGLSIGSCALRLDTDNAGKICALPTSDGLLAEWNYPAAIIKRAFDSRTDIPFSDDSISIWSVGLEWPESEVQAAVEILSSDEQERAKRFHRVSDRKHFIVVRAALRAILTRYLKVDPRQILFDHNTFGKPRLTGHRSYPDLRFNLAHSSGLALYVIANGREVGVDLERIEPEFATMGIVRSLFAPEEVAALSSLSNEDFLAGFYRCWTRKEAYVKAKGLGLSLPLQSFVVSVAPPNETPLLVADRNEIGKQTRWMLMDVNVGEGFAASLALECRA
jgi:4'-phosphopantetheinyl transferase